MTGSSASSSQKWYQTNWFLIFVSIVVPIAAIPILLFCHKDKTMKFKLIVAILLIIYSVIWGAFAIYGGTQAANRMSGKLNLTTQEQQEYAGVNFTIPEGWEAVVGDNVMRYYSDSSHTTQILVLNASYDTKTLKGAQDYAADMASGILDANSTKTVLSNDRTTVSGLPANKISYSTTVDSYDYSNYALIIGMPNSTTAIMLGCPEEDTQKYQEVFEQVMNSVSVVNADQVAAEALPADSSADATTTTSANSSASTSNGTTVASSDESTSTTF